MERGAKPMYIPSSFAETDLTTLHTFMQTHNFAALVTQHEGAMTATHLPLMLDASRGACGTLIGHLARANRQWQHFTSGQEVFVMFQGAHTYISPSWYGEHPSVPTWNYAVVHAYGTARIIDAPDDARVILQALVDHHEAGFPEPWPMLLPDDYMEKMLRALVCFEITITRLEGKFKLSQNRSEGDQQRVLDALSRSSYAPDNEVAVLMQRRAADR
jgi:transcriptional regulator